MFPVTAFREKNKETVTVSQVNSKDPWMLQPQSLEEALKGLYLKGLLSKHRSIACPLPLALASDLPCGVCTCKWDLQLPSPVRLWAEFSRLRRWRVTTALGNPFPCRKVCFAQKAPLDKPPLRLPDPLKNSKSIPLHTKRLPNSRKGAQTVNWEGGGEGAVELSCTRLRVPPVALHVSRYTCRSWFPGFYSVLQV